MMRDGTLRVVADVDPRFKANFHKLFPDIDTPIALAPLRLDFERIELKQQGPLCKLAAIWCKDRDFQEWIEREDEQEAAEWIRKTCEVESRRDLDSDHGAALRFQQFVREPFMDWMKGR